MAPTELKSPATRILFVCMGNTCRSPMVMTFARQAFADRGIPAIVESAGMMDELLDGVTFLTANQHSIDIVAEHGLELSKHVPRHISVFNLAAFDRIVCVNAAVKTKLIEFGAPEDRIRILNEAAGGLKDPYELGRAAYDECCVTVKAQLPVALEGIL